MESTFQGGVKMKYPIWMHEVFGKFPLGDDLIENNYWKKLYLEKLIKEGEYPFLINQIKQEIKDTENWLKEMRNNPNWFQEMEVEE